jgi:glycosyltransferase involved in cell wall biosynthesis
MESIENTAQRHKTPRVCIITEGFYPPSIGGQQKQLHDLGEKLVLKGVPVMVIVRQTHPPEVEREWVNQMEVIRVPPGGLLSGQGWRALWPLSIFLWHLFLVLIHERDKYDVLLVSGLKVLPLPAVLISYLFGKHCVIRSESPIELWQDLSAQSMAQMGLRADSSLIGIIRAVRYGLVKRSDRVIAISSQLKAAFQQVGIHPEQIELVPNGIDTTFFRPACVNEKTALRMALGLPADKTIFVFTGRLAASKGLSELMQVWKDLFQQDPTIHLLLVGSGADCFDNAEPELRDFLSRNRLHDSVTLTGAVNNVCDYLRASDVFVFPSHYEGFGLSIIEAMACGLPVVVTRVGVALDIVQPGRNGMLTPVKDVQQLSAAMRWMLEHRDQWPQMGTLACLDVNMRYSMDVVAGQYVALFMGINKPIFPHTLHSPFAGSERL